MAQAQDFLCLTANGKTMTAALESNGSVEEFKKLLPMTIIMSDYGGWEKVGDLPQSIIRDDRQMTAEPGDIMLYQGRSIVIFYGRNSWAYTPLGKLLNVSDSMLKEFLSGETVEVSFALSPASSVESSGASPDQKSEVADIGGRKINMNGRSISELPEGLYIINGKQTLIR